MATPRAVFRDLGVAVVLQFALMVSAGLTLDEGQFARATAIVCVAQWCGVTLILGRRRHALTRGDRWFVRYGALPLLLPALWAAFSYWVYLGRM